MAGNPVVTPTPSVEAFVTSESQPASVEVWVERITTPLLAQIPEIAEDAVLTSSVRASVRAHWLAFLATLGEPPREVVLVQPAAELAAELAQRRHQLTVLFRVYRLAQQAVWDYIRAWSRR